jgi:hypothetical protein
MFRGVRGTSCHIVSATAWGPHPHPAPPPPQRPRTMATRPPGHRRHLGQGHRATLWPQLATRWPYWLGTPWTRWTWWTMVTMTQWVHCQTLTQWVQCDPMGTPGNPDPMGPLVQCNKVANLANDTGKITYVRKGPKKGLNSPDFPLRRSVFYADKSDTLLFPQSPDATLENR